MPISKGVRIIAHILDAIIQLKDNFSGTLQTVEKSVGGFSRTARNMGKDVQRVGRDLENVGSKLTTTFTLPLVAGIGASINEFAKLEQSIGGVETLFKDSASTVIKNAETAYKRAGVSANGYMENVTSFSARLLQGLGGDTEQAAKIADMAMVDMSDNANKFGTDIGAIQNAYQGFSKGNFTMLDNLKLGFGGTQEEMARLINESGVMGEKFQATAKNVKDIPFDKMIEAIHEIQNGMGVTGTTTKEAMETVSGSIGMAKASLQDFLGGLGNSDADVDQLTKNMIESFKVVVKNIKEVLATMWDNIPLTGWQKNILAVLAVAGPFLLLIGKLTLGVSKGIFMFADFSKKVKALGLTMKAIVGPGAIVAGVIAALIIGGILLYKNWDKIKAKAAEVGQAISNATGITGEHIQNIIGFFKDLGLKVWGYLQGVIESFKPLVTTVVGVVKQIGGVLKGLMPILLPIAIFIASVFVGKIVFAFMLLVNKVKAVITAIAGVLDGLFTILSGVIEFVVGVFTADWDTAWNGIKTVFSGVLDIINALWQGLIDFLSAPVDAVVDILDSLFHDKIDGVRKAWEGIKEFFKNPIQGTVKLVEKGTKWLEGKIGANYAGTNNWRGGLTSIHERGGEIIDLPRGSRVYPHDKSSTLR